MTMIEKVARAICKARGLDPDQIYGHWKCWQGPIYDQARAAIEAMREFDYNMIFDLQHSLLGIIHMGELTPPQWNQVWQAMIDAALKEEKKANTATSP